MPISSDSRARKPRTGKSSLAKLSPRTFDEVFLLRTRPGSLDAVVSSLYVFVLGFLGRADDVKLLLEYHGRLGDDAANRQRPAGQRGPRESELVRLSAETLSRLALLRGKQGTYDSVVSGLCDVSLAILQHSDEVMALLDHLRDPGPAPAGSARPIGSFNFRATQLSVLVKKNERISIRPGGGFRAPLEPRRRPSDIKALREALEKLRMASGRARPPRRPGRRPSIMLPIPAPSLDREQFVRPAKVPIPEHLHVMYAVLAPRGSRGPTAR